MILKQLSKENNMFDREYSFTGTHAKQVSKLTSSLDSNSKKVLFNTVVEVFVLAPIIGFLYGRKGEKNREDNVDKKIFADAMLNHKEKIEYNYKLIILLDKEHEPDDEKRLDKAFRTFEHSKEDLELFNSYVLGGIEVLYDKLIGKATNIDEYINNLYDFIDEFNDRFASKTSSEEIVLLCQKIATGK